MGLQQNNDRNLIIIFAIILLVGILSSIGLYSYKNSPNTTNIGSRIFNKRNSFDVDKIPVANDYAISEYAQREISRAVQTIPDSDSLKEARYKQYIRDCIVEKFGDSYKDLPIGTEALLKINKQGQVEAYNIYLWKRAGDKNQNSESKNLAKQRLEQAVLQASPFQPFPKEMKKSTIITGVILDNGIVRELIYPDFNPEPKWSHVINQKDQKPNQRRYEDSKVVHRTATVNGWSGNQNKLYGIELYQKDLNNGWEPVKSVKNHVIVRGTIDDNMRITEPTFLLKSGCKEANERAIKALLSSTIPEQSSLSGRQINDLKMKSNKLTLELHFEVK